MSDHVVLSRRLSGFWIGLLATSLVFGPSMPGLSGQEPDADEVSEDPYKPSSLYSWSPLLWQSPSPCSAYGSWPVEPLGR